MNHPVVLAIRSAPRWQRAYLARSGVLAKLKAMRGPGESYSDLIIRVARLTESGAKRSKDTFDQGHPRYGSRISNVIPSNGGDARPSLERFALASAISLSESGGEVGPRVRA